MTTSSPSSSLPEWPALGDARAEVVETHTSVVVLVGKRAYKLKKPVSLGFLDFSTPEARRDACEREVALNRRLAPDVYLGVSEVRGVDGHPCDYLVVMRRLPEDRRLAGLAAGGENLDRAMHDLARLLAAFHARAERSAAIDEAAGAAATLRRFEVNASRLAALPGELHDPAASEEVLALARAYLGGREALLNERVAAGRACDGHGDLLADDVFLLPDGPRVLDCLEFDDALRYGDALGDVAFLAMDLDRLGRPDLAEKLLREYRRFSGDTWPASLAHLHVAYRAQVRALVAAVRASQGAPGLAETARALLRLAAAHLAAGQIRLVVVGGPPGSGKSTLASALADALGAVVVSSDEVRKQAAGLDVRVPAPAPMDAGIYAPRATASTYATLVARARVCLAHGVSVVLDATFHDPTWRSAARALAADSRATLCELRCQLPVDVARRRVRERLIGCGVSDATAEVAAALAGREAPWPTAVVVDTSAAPDEVLRAALAAVSTTGSLRSRP